MSVHDGFSSVNPVGLFSLKIETSLFMTLANSFQNKIYILMHLSNCKNVIKGACIIFFKVFFLGCQDN